MVKKSVVIIVLCILCFACTEKARSSRKLNGTWIASNGRTYIFSYPHIEYKPSEEHVNRNKGIHEQTVKLLSKEKFEALKGTYEVNENKIDITFTHSMYNGIWKEAGEKKVISFKYKLKRNNLILTNPLGQATKYKKHG